MRTRRPAATLSRMNPETFTAALAAQGREGPGLEAGEEDREAYEAGARGGAAIVALLRHDGLLHPEASPPNR